VLSTITSTSTSSEAAWASVSNSPQPRHRGREVHRHHAHGGVPLAIKGCTMDRAEANNALADVAGKLHRLVVDRRAGLR